MSEQSGTRESSAIVPPAPVHGKLGNEAYADHYLRSHQAIDDSVAYRAGYLDVLMLDALLREGYRLLDVGCGTAGYHRLLARHGEVIGIDPIPRMIENANQLKRELDVRNAAYACSDFESYEPSRRFDAIRATGVYGWYLPWHGRSAILEKIARLLEPSGIAVLSYVPPTSIWGAAKAALAPARTVVMFPRKILSMARRSGLVPLFEIRRQATTVIFARKEEER